MTHLCMEQQPLNHLLVSSAQEQGWAVTHPWGLVTTSIWWRRIEAAGRRSRCTTVRGCRKTTTEEDCGRVEHSRILRGYDSDRRVGEDSKKGKHLAWVMNVGKSSVLSKSHDRQSFIAEKDVNSACPLSCWAFWTIPRGPTEDQDKHA
jgi:hypothetical protein